MAVYIRKINERSYPNADEQEPGAGAAGGLGFAFATFLDAELKSGIEIVLEETKSGVLYQGCRYCYYGRRMSGWADSHGESSGWCCENFP